MIKHKKTSAILSILIIIVLLVSSTIAWFYLSTDVEVDYGSTVTVQAGHSIEVSLGNTNKWETKLNLTSSIGAHLIDITGDGINFYAPQNLDDDGVPGQFVVATPANDPNSTSVSSTGDSGDFLQYNISLRSMEELDIFLSGDSFIDPVSRSPEQENIFGTFSKDYIAGAVRLSVSEVDANGKETLKMIWAPNPEIMLSTSIGDNGKEYILTDKKGDDGAPGTPAEIVEYSKEKYQISVGSANGCTAQDVTAEQQASKLFVVGSTFTNDLMANRSPILTTLKNEVIEDNGQKIEIWKSDLILRVWFEGTDNEAAQALSGGVVKMNFKFTGMKKEVNTVLIEQVNAVSYDPSTKTYSGFNNKMCYSTDGFVWTQYTEGQNVPEPGENGLFIKGIETDMEITDSQGAPVNVPCYETDYRIITAQ